MINYRELVLENVDEGLLDPTEMLTMCLKHMTQDDVRKMLENNELLGIVIDDDAVKRLFNYYL